MATPSKYALVAGMREFYNNELFSDLTITCGDKSFPVHRNILFVQSPYFRKLLAGGFKESRTEQKVIAIEANPKVFETMLHFFYHSFYDDSARGSTAVSEHAILVYAIADQYDFPRLRDAAANKFRDSCNPQNSVEEFVSAIYSLEDHTAEHDRTLWEIVYPKIKANISVLCESPTFIKLATVDMPHLAVHLFKQLDTSAPTAAPSPLQDLALHGKHGTKRGGPAEDDDGEDSADEDDLQPPRGHVPFRGPGARDRGMGPGRRLG